ncbi:MAG: biotin--[acetyl-CoA-carboxylase] ligase [Bifidobacteriaceae bacterium]|nr:biotin--[acetyl-CoA-carboxylase] ligase [Bifidobacteriaceae bacterium]
MRHPLDPDRLNEALVRQGPYASVEVVQEVDSTNAELARRACLGQPAAAPDLGGSGRLTALLAEYQSRGRGRQHPGEGEPRPWIAPPRSSVIASVLVSPPARARERRTALGLALALAAMEAIDLVAPGQAGLKWPNDVMMAGRKLAGVLASATPGGDVVVGIGLNVSQTEAELPDARAGSLALLGAPDVDRDWLAIAVLSAAATWFERWAADGGRLAEAVGARMATLGRPAAIRLPDGTVATGRAEAVGEDGALSLRRADGGVARIDAGELI